MNECIKQLAKQAESYAYKHEEQWHDGPDWQDLFKEKFAELIVRECAKFCDDKNSKLLGTMMKEHFGV